MDSKDRVVSRFVYRANGCGAGGYFTRVLEDTTPRALPTRSSVSLPVTGGKGQSCYDGYALRAGKMDLFMTGPVATKAETRANEKDGTTDTWVMAEASDVWVYGGFEIPYVKAHLEASSSPKDEIGPIRTGKCVLNEVRLGDRVVKVELDLDTFRRCDTMPEVEREVRERPRDFIVSDKGVIIASIVRKLSLVGDSDPRIQIEGHTIHWDDFGWIILGEILISKQYRRLTMVRLELGSPIGGRLAIGETETDGHTLP